MALKYVSEYNNTAKVGDKIFKFKPWTTKNEKDFLIAVEAEKDISDSMLYELLVKPCLEDQNVVLSPNEQKMLMIEIRKKSLGGSFPMRYACTSCGNVNDVDIMFDDIVKFSPDNFTTVEEDDIIFKFGPIVSENLKKKLDDTGSTTEYAFNEFLIHIQSIIYKEQLEDSFTFDELKTFVEALPSSVFDKIYDEFVKMKSSLTFEYSTKCIICNAENEIDFSNIPNFLWA